MKASFSCQGWKSGSGRKQRCPLPSVYQVFKSNEIQRCLCGFHAQRYLNANRGALLKAKILGQKVIVPYAIWSTPWARGNLTRKEKELLSKWNGSY